jgi:hypothetical protein
MTLEMTPPPGDIHELAERAVDFVRRAVGITLDYTPETLPVLDHYLRSVPADRPELVTLVAASSGAYFGEVIRRAMGGEWEDDPEQDGGWRLTLVGNIQLAPIGIARETITKDDSLGVGGWDVPLPHREAVEEAMTAAGEVPEDEYYSLSGRLETLHLIADVVAGRLATTRA